MLRRSIVSALLFVVLLILLSISGAGTTAAAPDTPCTPTTGPQLKNAIQAGTCSIVQLAAKVYNTSNIIINRNVEIDGAGKTLTVIDGGSKPLLHVNPNKIVTVQNLTLRNGFNNVFSGGALANVGGTVHVTAVAFSNDSTPSLPGFFGGAIESSGPLTISDSDFIGNKAVRGGAIFHADGDLTIHNSNFVRNQATSDSGGAVFFGTDTGGALVIDHSTFSSNTAALLAGAIYVYSNNVTITASQFAANIASAGKGGAIYINSCAACVSKIIRSSFVDNQALDDFGGALAQDSSHLIIRNSTFSSNVQQGTFGGGALYLNGTDATILGSTFDHNHSDAAGGAINTVIPTNITNSTFAYNQVSGIPASGFGGEIYSFSTTNLLNVTLVGNQAFDGGNVDAEGGIMNLKNTILAQGSNWNCGDGDHYQSQGSNLSNDPTCKTWFTRPGDRNGVAVKLGPFGNNGGPTKTFLPLAGSPAINGVVSGCPPPAIDQRGVARPQNSKCDIGAVEVQ